jgi:hypothetical protein
MWTEITSSVSALGAALCKRRNRSRMKRRAPSPSARVIDSQSVEIAESGRPPGYDASKKVKGRRRHIITDTIGLLVGAERQKPSRGPMPNHLPRENVVHEPAIACPAPPLGERVQMSVPALETAIEPVRPWPYHSIANQVGECEFPARILPF